MSVAVVDASALVALFLDVGELGTWVADELRGHRVAAPHLVMFETANVIRRHLAARLVTLDAARHANRFLSTLDIELWPYEALAERAWELRSNLTTYDASYVALAELLSAPVITLDGRIAAVERLRCPVRTPPRPNPGRSQTATMGGSFGATEERISGARTRRSSPNPAPLPPL